MDRDPFRVLLLGYDASPDDVRRAFRRLARETHPDRGGSATAFYEIRTAYDTLTSELEAARRRWTPATGATPAPRYAGGLDPREFPTCPVEIGAERGRRRVRYDIRARPAEWAPGVTLPPGGRCVERHPATDTTPAFGVWIVPLDAERYRCVFGPYRGG